MNFRDRLMRNTRLGRLLRFVFLPRETNRRHALLLFALLQLYFLSNILSFGFWSSSEIVLLYMLAYFAVWLAGLSLLLYLWLLASTRFNLRRFDLVVLVGFSAPLSYGVWLESIDVARILLYAAYVLLPLALFVVFLLGLPRLRIAAGAVLVLCALSFVSHADFSAADEGLDDSEAITLDSKPSIHVVALDSFAHSAYSREFMGIGNPAADYLAGLEDAIYAGTIGFVERVPTKRFWGGIFSLDSRRHKKGNFRAFSGSLPSLLTQILRGNGYTISTGFSTNYFGDKGRFIDHYYTTGTRLKNSLVCTWDDLYLLFCSNFSYAIFDYMFPVSDRSLWPNHVIGLIERTEQEARGPQFSAYYMFKPIGHTPKHFRIQDPDMVADYKAMFVREAQNARQVIEDIDELRRRYPESIFIVTGDHGPYLSRTAPEEDRRFRVLDRHGVALALLNASNLCPWSREWLERQRYLTPSRMLAAALACDGESRTLTEHFEDNEEFVQYGEWLAAQDSSRQ